MRHDESKRWFELAERISGGASIDWNTESAEDGRDAAILKSFRSIAAIAQLHTKDRGLDMPGLLATDGLALPDALLAPAPERWGSLRILEELGRGSYGTVYRAEDETLQREVALKLMHPGRALPHEARERMVREGRNLARVRHENVVTVHGAEERDGQVGLWMERVEGSTLAELVQQHGPFSEDETTVMARTLCRAVAAVHQAGLLHRDIKAQNVMREEGGRLVLMDFGAGSDVRETSGPRVPGTPLYLAPELLRGESASASTDVYSLGVLLFHLATGSYPLVATSIDELREKHERGDQRSLLDLRSDLSSDFVSVVERALHPDPAQRWSSAGEMARAFDGPSEIARSGRPARWMWGIAAVLALALGSLWLRPGSSAYEIDFSLYRLNEHSRDELFSGAHIRPEESLVLEVEASRELYVYVLNEDDFGNAYVLFPIPGNEPTNPLPAGVTHLLPGKRMDVTQSWAVSSAGGREQVIVVASPEPLAELEEQLAGLPFAGEREAAVAYPSAPPALVRGIGALVPAPSSPSTPGGRLADVVGEFADERASAEGVWVRRIELVNPMDR